MSFPAELDADGKEAPMGAKIHIRAQYGPHAKRLLTDSGAAVALGSEAGTFAPYELLLGALSSCVHSTFESVVEKMQLAYESVEMQVQGEKRDEKIATLQTCHLHVEITGAEDRDKVTKAFEIATRYCSIYNTLSHVASMTWDIVFV